MSAHVDYERRVFVCADGSEFHLQPVSNLALERLNADQTGRPSVPKVEVVIAGKHKRVEENPNDPAYLEAIKTWEFEKRRRLLKFVFSHGIREDIPPEFVEDYREYFPEASRGELKYLWVGSKVDQNTEDLDLLITAITGQTAITEQGVNTAIDSFQGDGERDRREEIPAQEPADPVAD